MSTLDTARLFAWLIEAEHDATTERDTANTTGAALAADDRAWAYQHVLARLRSRAHDQHHRCGDPVDPDATIAAGALTVETDELWSWLMLQAAGDPVEGRAKTYAAIAAELDRFIQPPDPFPTFGDEPDPPLAAAVGLVAGSYCLGLWTRLADRVRRTTARLKVRP
ncbi:MAG: hypothetical protein AAGE88_18345 [Actinomycetota bacterium]